MRTKLLKSHFDISKTQMRLIPAKNKTAYPKFIDRFPTGSSGYFEWNEKEYKYESQNKAIELSDLFFDLAYEKVLSRYYPIEYFFNDTGMMAKISIRQDVTAVVFSKIILSNNDETIQVSAKYSRTPMYLADGSTEFFCFFQFYDMDEESLLVQKLYDKDSLLYKYFNGPEGYAYNTLKCERLFSVTQGTNDTPGIVDTVGDTTVFMYSDLDSLKAWCSKGSNKLRHETKSIAAVLSAEYPDFVLDIFL